MSRRVRRPVFPAARVLALGASVGPTARPTACAGVPARRAPMRPGPALPQVQAPPPTRQTQGARESLLQSSAQP